MKQILKQTATIFTVMTVFTGGAFPQEVPLGHEEKDKENETFQESHADPIQEQRAELQRMLEQRIGGEFAFEVIDQDNRPVPNVHILFKVCNVSATFAKAFMAQQPFEGGWTDSEQVILTTNAQGIAYTKRVSANNSIKDNKGHPLIDGDNKGHPLIDSKRDTDFRHVTFYAQ